jgi:predicted nucleic acid-binding protein
MFLYQKQPIAGNAQFIVTGDLDLLTLKSVHNILIF